MHKKQQIKVSWRMLLLSANGIIIIEKIWKGVDQKMLLWRWILEMMVFRISRNKTDYTLQVKLYKNKNKWDQMMLWCLNGGNSNI